MLQAKLSSDVSMLQHFARTLGDAFRARNLIIQYVHHSLMFERKIPCKKEFAYF